MTHRSTTYVDIAEEYGSRRFNATKKGVVSLKDACRDIMILVTCYGIQTHIYICIMKRHNIRIVYC